MNEPDDWAELQDAWASDTKAALPDVAPMIARAQRERRLTMWTIAGEWGLLAIAAASMVESWPRVKTDGLMFAWWVFFAIVAGVGTLAVTWIRVAALREPAGASLRDWLQLRRRRALLGLRLVRLTRWSLVTLLPAPVVVVVGSRSATSAAFGIAMMVLIFGGTLLWARRKTARMTAEIAEVDALALEWLDQPLTT